MKFDVLEPPRTGASVKEVYIPCYLCENVVQKGSICTRAQSYAPVRGGSSTSNLLELHPHRDRCSQRRFGPVEPPRTYVKEIYIPSSLCEDVYS